MLNSTNITYLWDEKALITEEDNRRKRLIRTYTLINLVVAAIFFGLYLLPIPAPVYTFPPFAAFSLSFLFSLMAYIFARQERFLVASWVMLVTQIVFVTLLCVLLGSNVSAYVIFLLPLCLAATLLDVRGIIALTAFCIVIDLSIILLQDVFAVLPQFIKIETANTITAKFAFGGLLIPAIILIIFLPSRTQARVLQAQNRRLLETLYLLNQRQQTIEEVSSKIVDLSFQLKDNASLQADGSRQQASVISQLNTSAAELSNTAAQITNTAQQIRVASEVMANKSQLIVATAIQSAVQAEEGLQTVAQTINTSQAVASLYRRFTDVLSELNSKSVNLRRIVQLLGSITNETHLLSLNAAIEAAGAGEYGRRFAIVAQQVKDLAQNSAKTQQEVFNVIKKMEQMTTLAVGAVEDGFRKAEDMEQAAGKSGAVIEKMAEITKQAQTQATAISQAAAEVKQLGDTIRVTTFQQQGASEQLLNVISGLTEIAQLSTASSATVSSTVLDLGQVSQRLKRSLAA